MANKDIYIKYDVKSNKVVDYCRTGAPSSVLLALRKLFLQPMRLSVCLVSQKQMSVVVISMILVCTIDAFANSSVFLYTLLPTIYSMKKLPSPSRKLDKTRG